jgi:hypothetical protein
MKAALIFAACLFSQAALSAQEPKPIIDNERVIVWLTDASQKPAPVAQGDYDRVLVIYGKNTGSAMYVQKGKKGLASVLLAGKPEHTLIIGLKDHPVAPLPNKTKYPNAFPRPNVKKLIDNDRVTTWEYTWEPGVPTPMHFHDKDVVVVYLDEGSLKSTTPDGASVINDYTYGLVKFNPRDRTHTELLTKGTQHAIMTELK